MSLSKDDYAEFQRLRAGNAVLRLGKFPDLLKRDFTADRLNARWVGDITEIPTDAGKLYLATVIDLYPRRQDRIPTPTWCVRRSRWPSQVVAVSMPDWRVDETQRVVFHTDRGSTYTANSFTRLCRQLRGPAVHEQGRFVFRQRRSGGVLLELGVGGPLTPPVREHSPGPGRRAGLVLRVYNHERRRTSAPHREALHDSGGTTLAYFTTHGANNGGPEAINGLIELHRRIARGFRNRHNYRLRCLLIAVGLTP